MKKALAAICLSALLSLSLFTGGCTSTQKAQDASKAIAVVLTIAQAEAGLVPAGDQVIYNGFVSLGNTLEGQLNTCIGGLGLMSKNAAFLGCFNAFASGLTSPAELAQLRILSAGTQGRVQIIVAGVIAGVNIAVDAFGGSSVSVPVVASSPASQASIQQLRQQVLEQLNGKL